MFILRFLILIIWFFSFILHTSSDKLPKDLCECKDFTPKARMPSGKSIDPNELTYIGSAYIRKMAKKKENVTDYDFLYRTLCVTVLLNENWSLTTSSR